MTDQLIAPVIPPAADPVRGGPRRAGEAVLLPLADPLAVPLDAVYGMSPIDTSGRLTSQAISQVLDWRPGDRLTLTVRWRGRAPRPPWHGHRASPVFHRDPGRAATPLRAPARGPCAAGRAPCEDTLAAYTFAVVDRVLRRTPAVRAAKEDGHERRDLSRTAVRSQQAAVEAALCCWSGWACPLPTSWPPQGQGAMPTFAEYVPVVSAAVSAGTRRAYGSYWNGIIEHWGARRLDEPTPSEIRQLMTWVKTHVVARRNARGGRSAQEHLVAALRCLYRRAVEDGLIARRTTRRGRWPSRGGCRPLAGPCPRPGWRRSTRPPRPWAMIRSRTSCCCGCTLRPPAAAAARWPCGRPTWTGPVPDPAAREGRDGALAAGFPHADGPPGTARPGPPRATRRAAAAVRRRAASTSRRYDHLWIRIGRQLPWVRTQQISTHWIRHILPTSFGFATAQTYAGHEDHGRGGKAMATYIRAGLPEVATALAAVVLTGMPGSRPRGARRSTNGPGMKAGGSPPGRWNLAGREPRQNMPRSARQLPGGAIQAGSAGLPRRAR